LSKRSPRRHANAGRLHTASRSRRTVRSGVV
jgi:hypothetical protein